MGNIVLETQFTNLTLSLPKSRRQNFHLQILQKVSVQDISYWDFKDYRANSVDLDEVAHNEPPHLDLRCLQIQLFSSLVVKELKNLNKQLHQFYNISLPTEVQAVFPVGIWCQNDILLISMWRHNVNACRIDVNMTSFFTSYACWVRNALKCLKVYSQQNLKLSILDGKCYRHLKM